MDLRLINPSEPLALVGRTPLSFVENEPLRFAEEPLRLVGGGELYFVDNENAPVGDLYFVNEGSERFSITSPFAPVIFDECEDFGSGDGIIHILKDDDVRNVVVDNAREFGRLASEALEHPDTFIVVVQNGEPVHSFYG